MHLSAGRLELGHQLRTVHFIGAQHQLNCVYYPVLAAPLLRHLAIPLLALRPEHQFHVCLKMYAFLQAHNHLLKKEDVCAG